MFQGLLAAGLILAAADPTPNPGASPPDKAPVAAAPAAKAPKQVCREQAVLGSRFSKTVCTSRAETDETASRDKLNQLQTNRAR